MISEKEKLAWINSYMKSVWNMYIYDTQITAWCKEQQKPYLEHCLKSDYFGWVNEPGASSWLSYFCKHQIPVYVPIRYTRLREEERLKQPPKQLNLFG